MSYTHRIRLLLGFRCFFMPKQSQQGYSRRKKIAFVIQSYTVTKTQFDYIKSLTERLHDDIVKLFRHILASTFVQARDYGGIVPVSAKLIRNELPRAEYPAWAVLQELELIKYLEASFKAGKSRRFIVSPDVLSHFLALSPIYRNTEASYIEYAAEPKVNLMSGFKAVPKKATVYLPNGNPAPPLVRDAIKTIKTCFYDLPAALKLLDRTQQSYQDLWESQDEPGRYFYRYINDNACVSFLNELPRKQTKQVGVYSFETDYSPLESGRISSRLQSATRELKFAMYNQINDLNNYDLKSSQAVILRHFMREAGIPCPWLDEYLDNPEAKAEYAQQVGFKGSGAEDCWKNCLYALFMGAALPWRTDKPEEFRSIELKIYEQVGTLEGLQPAYERFKAVVGPLKESIDKWHDYLLNTFANNPENIRRSGRLVYVRNACNMPFCVTPSDKSITAKNKIKRELAAHMLQGQEACFIHHLTLLGKDYDYRPIGNEHDGLIVIGEIPPEAIELAKERSGLPADAVLAQKNDFSENSAALLIDESWADLPEFDISIDGEPV